MNIQRGTSLETKDGTSNRRIFAEPTQIPRPRALLAVFDDSAVSVSFRGTLGRHCDCHDVNDLVSRRVPVNSVRILYTILWVRI